MEQYVAESSSNLSLGEKLFSIPISVLVIVLGLLESSRGGFSLHTYFPIFIGLENLAFIAYRKYPQYRKKAFQIAVALFTTMAIILIIY